MSTALDKRPVVSRQPETHSDKTAEIGADMGIGIGSFGSWMIGVGAIIGSYAWLIHGPMIARAGTTATIAAWLLAAVMTIPVGLILAELSSMFPTAGGPYVYKYYAFKRLMPKSGELVGFLTGWLFYVAVLTGLACMSNGLVNLLSSSFWGSASASPLWFGPVVITALFGTTTVLNMTRVGKAAKVNNIFTLMKFAMALGFGALVLFSPQASLANFTATAGTAGSTGFWQAVGSVFLLALSGYCGVEMAGCTSSETKDARKNVPRAILLTLATVALFYVGMGLAVGVASPYVLSPDKTTVVVPGTTVQATCPAVAGYLGGPLWGNLMTAAVVASIIGCGFSCLLACARVGYSMAETGLFPKQFGRLCAKTQVPTYSLWFQFWVLCSIGIAANLLSRTGVFADAYVFLGEVFGFLYAFLALLYGFCLMGLRYTDPDMPRPFRVGGTGNGLAWVLTLVAAVVYGVAAFGCTGLIHQLSGLLLLAVGVPIYYSYRMGNS